MESCDNDLIKRIRERKVSKLDTPTTCILTHITFGIHAVVVIQLPPNEQNEIDALLLQLRDHLIDNKHPIEITSKQKDLLRQITSTRVYSNTPSLSEMTDLYDIYQKIQQMKRNSKDHRPLKYTLASIQALNSEHPVTNTALNVNISEAFENDLLQQSSELRTLEVRLGCELPELLQGKLEERLKTLRESVSEIKQLYDNDFLQQIREQLVLLRQGQDVWNNIEQIMDSDVQITIKDSIRRLNTSLDNLELKGKLIKKLENDGFEYCNVFKLEIKADDKEQAVKDALLNGDQNKKIFCSSDQLKQQLPGQWDSMYSELTEERKKNVQLTLIYADITYCPWKLDKMKILTPDKETITRHQSTMRDTSRRPKRAAPLAPMKSIDNFINILLIGESGVGKSTFINAFANYLEFDSLEEAQKGEPVVVIPVSFLMTTNDDFDEQLVKFGESDPNENHMSAGQSVTQHCRSYVFDLGSGKKLRIIDTPGFGDTRGDDQDDINMQMIFSFLSNLTHLNGICLLLKPNVQKLNPFLYPCLTQLLRYFGEDISKQLIFCFTNARSTFFSPGDTRPLLKSLLNSLPVKNTPFEKRNTFCFDSESFRYLVALQRSLTFNDIARSEFEKSWEQSVEESKRLRNFLVQELQPYRKNVEWKSIPDAQWQISVMIRPILEAIRNILRNIILYETKSSIRLYATHVDRSMMICYTEDRSLERVGGFWIFSDHLRSLPIEVSIQNQLKRTSK